MLDAVQGPGVGDPFVIAPPLRRYAEEVGAPVGRLRVAVSLSGMMDATIDDDIRDEVMRVARHLESLGHYVTEWGALPLELVVIDEVTPRDAQYLHVGSPRGPVVPVSFYGLNQQGDSP